MDIVSRLKFFMESQQIVSSQFADTCKIPRPTLSQLLNGRNKKISDEIISKVHEAYPLLSIMWLMFGEGDMLTGENIGISEGKNHINGVNLDTKQPIEQANSAFRELGESIYKNEANNISTLETPQIIKAAIEELNQKHNMYSQTGQKQSNENTYKKIVNVMVFYSDSTFEQFTPYN